MVALAPNTSETSTWDVHDTFPKLHSRAREVKTPSCTEAHASKSLSRVEIWLMIYDDRIRLESFTRDPIGFDGGRKNIFEFLSDSPLSRIDPMGKLDAGATTVTCAAATAAGIPVGTASACGATFVGVGYCVSYYPSTYCANKVCEVHLWLINGSPQRQPLPEPVTQAQPVSQPIPVPLPVPVQEPPTRETYDSQGRTKCSPSIDYVSGEPGAACRACAGTGFPAGPGATHYPSDSTDPLDLIESNGFQYGTIKHHSCKKGKGSSDQFSIICGFCCVDGPNGPDFRKRCKCARTGGF